MTVSEFEGIFHRLKKLSYSYEHRSHRASVMLKGKYTFVLLAVITVSICDFDRGELTSKKKKRKSILDENDSDLKLPS